MGDQDTTSGRRKPGPNPALRMALIRNIHSWIGLFIAPSVLFFAVTGALQMFKFHESHGDYHPPAVIEKLGRLHKDQVFAVHPPRPAPAKAAAAPAPEADDDHDHDHDHADHDHDHADRAKAPGAKAVAGGDKPAAKPAAKADEEDADPWNTVAIRWLFLAVSVGLSLSTLLGVWMALQPHRRKPSSWILLAAGVVLPVLLVLV